jgi:hypothetical protein
MAQRMTADLAFQAFDNIITPEYPIIPSSLAKRLASCYLGTTNAVPPPSPSEIKLLPWFHFLSFRVTFNHSKIMFSDLALLETMSESLSQLTGLPDIATCVRARLLMALISLFCLNRAEAQIYFSTAGELWSRSCQNRITDTFDDKLISYSLQSFKW